MQGKAGVKVSKALVNIKCGDAKCVVQNWLYSTYPKVLRRHLNTNKLVRYRFVLAEVNKGRMTAQACGISATDRYLSSTSLPMGGCFFDPV
jgi:hypothetical protein